MRRRRDLAAGRQSSAFSLLFQAMWATCRAARSVAANRRKTGRGVVEILVRTRSRAQGRSRFGGRDLQIHRFYATGTIYGRRAKRPHLETERTS